MAVTEFGNEKTKFYVLHRKYRNYSGRIEIALSGEKNTIIQISTTINSNAKKIINLIYGFA